MRDTDSQIQRTNQGQQWRGERSGGAAQGLEGKVQNCWVKTGYKGCTVQHKDYSQYFITTGNGK